jgi:hypothetical protein
MRPGVGGALLALALVACSGTPPSTAPSHAPSPTLSSTPPTSSASPYPTTVEPTKAPVFPVDSSLLAILPETVEGLVLAPSPEGEASLQDPSVYRLAVRGEAAIAVDPASGDFVYAVILVLRPGAFDEAGYRDWRDSFDEGACSQAGGVVGNAEAEIGGHRTFIGTCAGGLHTYHAWLMEPGLLVSASAVGAARLGEALIAGLRP